MTLTPKINISQMRKDLAHQKSEQYFHYDIWRRENKQWELKQVQPA